MKASSCTCGRPFDRRDTTTPLEASFVQVLSSGVDDAPNDSCLHLLHAATSPTEPPVLCGNCIQRVERAIEADTARLEHECCAYREAVRQDQQRTRGLEAQTTAESFTDAQASLEEEINALEEACRLSEVELERLGEIMREQLAIKDEMDDTMRSAAQDRNVLLHNAKTFDEEQTQLSRDLQTMQTTHDNLSSFPFTASIVSLQVDTHRGLRYPLINGLRLAYRPKGDLDWKEVQAAWSLAGHLLFTVGTIFELTGQQWKLLPLSDCVKLFYYPKPKGDGTNLPPVIFNLGHPDTKGCKALLTWNAALSQTIHHAWSVLADVMKDARPPYDVSPTTISTLVLPKLAVDDDASWAKAIHYMASNLLWLSTCADAYLQEKVGTMAVLNSTKEFVAMDDRQCSPQPIAMDVPPQPVK